MTDAGAECRDVEHWDAFWQARDKAITQEDAGAQDPAHANFWGSYFRREFSANRSPSLIDIACGNGAVTEIAIAAARDAGAELAAHCADYSAAAIDELRKRFPDVTGIACDAAEIPYPDRRFDFVVSQFGIEYAGAAAFSEAARLVSDRGAFAALVHMAGGAIQAECEQNRAVAQTLRESQLIPLARSAFAAGFDLLAGKSGDKEFQEADRRLAPAVETAKRILREQGPLAAGGLVANLYKDIGYMYRRMQNYVPAEVFAWIDAWSGELVSYEGRMDSMTRCAIDGAGIRVIADSLGAAGLSVDPPGVLSLVKSGKPAAWVLTARRIPQSPE